MNLYDAIELANNYFLNIYNENVNTRSILDAGSHWIFYPGQNNVIEFGLEGIKIKKETGAIEDFVLPDDENFNLLAQSTKVILEGK